MPSIDYRVAELERKLGNIIRIATVVELNGDRVKVKDGNLVTGFLPWVTRRAGKDRDWWAPEPGEQVVLLCPSGDPGLGIVLPSLYQDAFPAPADVPTIRRWIFSDGAVIEYDRAAHLLKAIIPGTIEAMAEDVIITANVRINGPLHVTEAITSDTSMAAPKVTGSRSVSAPSIKADGKEITGHDHACPNGGRTSILGE